MKQLLHDIAELDYLVIGSSLKESAVEEAFDVLNASGRPDIPEELIDFLHLYNGASREDGCLWGIDDKHHSIYDIVAENLVSHNPNPDEVLLLGENTLTYIAWNSKNKKYTMIDKSSFAELHCFETLAEAISYVLKIIG